jgi:uncharacterized protein YjbI with pentapeptide repeats
MANENHLFLIQQGITVWNEWRTHNSAVPDLRGAVLNKLDLEHANFNGANLEGAQLREASLHRAFLENADLTGADLSRADMSHAEAGNATMIGTNFTETNLPAAKLSFATLNRADFTRAKAQTADLRAATLTDANLTDANFSDAWISNASLSGANLEGANLRNCDLRRACLSRANLVRAKLSGADLREADLTGALLQDAILTGAILVRTDLTDADLTGCFVYGISAWDVITTGTIQKNLVVTPGEMSVVTVDNLAVAQFIYLLLSNPSIRDVIDADTSKVVLILGRFTPDRKPVLEALRNHLRGRGYSPVIFDFEKPSQRDLTETISTLAGMSRFVIADVTEAKSIPQELMAIVPHFPSVPVQPLIVSGQEPYAMFEHFKRYPWVLPMERYVDLNDLLQAIDRIIIPAEAMAKKLTP